MQNMGHQQWEFSPLSRRTQKHSLLYGLQCAIWKQSLHRFFRQHRQGLGFCFRKASFHLHRSLRGSCGHLIRSTRYPFRNRLDGLYSQTLGRRDGKDSLKLERTRSRVSFPAFQFRWRYDSYRFLRQNCHYLGRKNRWAHSYFGGSW